MSSRRQTETRYAVVCIDPDADTLAVLRHDVEDTCNGMIEVHVCPDAAQAAALMDELGASGIRVPLVITEQFLPDGTGVDFLLSLLEKPAYLATRKVLASSRANVLDLTRALNKGALHRNIVKPWTTDVLSECVRSLLTGFFVHHAPDDCARFESILDTAQFPRSFRSERQRLRAFDLQVQTLKRSFLANIEMNDKEVDDAMGACIDEALGNPPRRDFPAGSVLLRQSEPVDTIFILVSGRVQLSREANGREVVLHTNNAGRIIGLLALAHGQKAFYTWQATTDITVIPLTLEQLDTALQADPWLSGYLVTSLIRTMANRSNRTAELVTEVEKLNDELLAERDRLTDALQQLEESQTRLVESQKMATLGQLSAGVAHELNNPIAAIGRAAEFLNEDLVALLGESPDGEALKVSMLAAIAGEPMSTREQRERRAALAEVIGDDALAQRLMRAGITTPQEYRSRFGRARGEQQERLLTAMERYHQLGLSLKNISSCSRRVTAIVDSLRAYTRSDEASTANVNLHEGLDGTLLMFGHAMREVEIIKSYGDLPDVTCHVGQINQVWTNIIANALQAMNNKGVLRIETDVPDAEHVRVRVTDSGHGVKPEHLDRVFELKFTTKQGRTTFGLGMGLAICRQIVTRHDGTIAISSEPGRTCVTVVLPSHRPPASCEG
ncbi:MAG: ATP-binding protein [Planctomycetota bacterium]